MILVFIRVHSRILICVYIYGVDSTRLIQSTENSRVHQPKNLLAPQTDEILIYKELACDESTRFSKSRQEKIPLSHEDPGKFIFSDILKNLLKP